MSRIRRSESAQLRQCFARRCFWATFAVALLAVSGVGFAADPWKIAVRGQTAGTIERSMLLFGEIHDSSGRQIGSYFEKFQPTQVDPKTGAPLAGTGESLFRLPNGTIATKNNSRVVGPGPKPNSLKVETTGQIVKAAGIFNGMTGTFTSQSVVSATFTFQTDVTFNTSGGTPIAAPQTPTVVRHCTYHIIPASCCRPTYTCYRVPICEPRKFRPPTCARQIRCRN